MGGVLLCFGNQLLLGAVIGGLAAYINHRQGWIQWQHVIGADPVSTSTDGPSSAPPPGSALGAPLGTAGVAMLALVFLVVGVFFWGLGTVRSLEGVTLLADFGCPAPCGMVRGLWVQVLPDSHGNVVSQPDAETIAMRVSLRDDAPGEKQATSNDFGLTDPDVTYLPLTNRPGCVSWALRLHIDDSTGPKTLCFLDRTGVTVDPGKLVLNWGLVKIPLGQPLMSLESG